MIEVLDSAPELAQVAVGESPVEPGIDVAGFERKAVVEVVNSIAMPVKEHVSRGSPAVRLGIIQTKLDPLSVGVNSFLRLSEILERATQGVIDGGSLEPETGRLLRPCAIDSIG